MGTFRSTFKPQYSAALADRAHTVPAAAKTSSPEPPRSSSPSKLRVLAPSKCLTPG